jgi:hypothetical protein
MTVLIASRDVQEQLDYVDADKEIKPEGFQATIVTTKPSRLLTIPAQDLLRFGSAVKEMIQVAAWQRRETLLKLIKRSSRANACLKESVGSSRRISGLYPSVHTCMQHDCLPWRKLSHCFLFQARAGSRSDCIGHTSCLLHACRASSWSRKHWLPRLPVQLATVKCQPRTCKQKYAEAQAEHAIGQEPPGAEADDKQR